MNPRTRTAPPLPASLEVTIDRDTRKLDERTLFGGSPARVLRITSAGQRALEEIYNGTPRSTAARVLARRLTDTGLAHPKPSPKTNKLDVTVVVPVRDRPESLDQTLKALAGRVQVIVVDDASVHPQRIAEVAKKRGASLIVRAENGGPAAARNTGMLNVETDFVAFLDSDCIPSGDWLSPLLGHFDDPLVGAVAPRVVAAPDSSLAGRYGRSCGPLDLGDRAARVVPGSRVAYVPTAALMVRRTALDDVAREGNIFDPALRVGEDVDLVWRLDRAGWRVRYDPSVQVAHLEPGHWPELLARRFRYGTSAAPLSKRHPDSISHLVLQFWPTLVVASLLARRPGLATGFFAGQLLSLRSRLKQADIPQENLLRSSSAGVYETWRGVGRYCTQLAGPALVTALVATGRGKRSNGRRLALSSLILGPAVAKYLQVRPEIDPIRFCLLHIADEIAYGSGVWFGCIRHRTMTPVKPQIISTPKRYDP
ncbi:MAG: mycofactocin biosynthesis glycosyltransferase MftF [Acidimicrobiales bacterium]